MIPRFCSHFFDQSPLKSPYPSEPRHSHHSRISRQSREQSVFVSRTSQKHSSSTFLSSLFSPFHHLYLSALSSHASRSIIPLSHPSTFITNSNSNVGIPVCSLGFKSKTCCTLSLSSSITNSTTPLAKASSLQFPARFERRAIRWRGRWAKRVEDAMESAAISR